MQVWLFPFPPREAGACCLGSCLPGAAWAVAAVILAFRRWERLSTRRNKFSFGMGFAGVKSSFPACEMVDHAISSGL